MGQEYGKKNILKIVYCEFYKSDILIIISFISMKHRILATFNINKKFNSDSLYAFE